jgi:hypothetical protein
MLGHAELYPWKRCRTKTYHWKCWSIDNFIPGNAEGQRPVSLEGLQYGGLLQYTELYSWKCFSMETFISGSAAIFRPLPPAVYP